MLEVLFLGSVMAGALTFGGWAVYTWTRTELAASPDWTSWAIFQTGRALVWVAIAVLAGGVLGAVVFTAVRVLGGGRG